VVKWKVLVLKTYIYAWYRVRHSFKGLLHLQLLFSWLYPFGMNGYARFKSSDLTLRSFERLNTPFTIF
jgi:hypothetical protein